MLIKNKEENISIYYDISFDSEILDKELGIYANDWPVTYILYNRQNIKAYVGETTGFKSRMKTYLTDSSKEGYRKC